MTNAARRLTSRAPVLLPILAAGLLASVAIGAIPRGHAATARLAPEHLTIRASAPHMPGQMPAGILELTLVNDTRAEADADVGRATPGATEAQINAADAAANAHSLQGFVRLTQLVTFIGGTNSVPPGSSETAILDLRTPGRYGLQVGNFQEPGTRLTFTVTPGAGQGATLPPADVVVRLKDMKFLGLPRHLPAGKLTLQVNNEGPSAHELLLVRLDPGKTQRDVLDVLRQAQGQIGPPPPWAHPGGGMDSISPHQSAEVRLDLARGYYVVVCFMPDVKKQGTPHVMEGMIGHFTVR